MIAKITLQLCQRPQEEPLTSKVRLVLGGTAQQQLWLGSPAICTRTITSLFTTKALRV